MAGMRAGGMEWDLCVDAYPSALLQRTLELGVSSSLRLLGQLSVGSSSAHHA